MASNIPNLTHPENSGEKSRDNVKQSEKPLFSQGVIDAYIMNSNGSRPTMFKDLDKEADFRAQVAIRTSELKNLGFLPNTMLIIETGAEPVVPDPDKSYQQDFSDIDRIPVTTTYKWHREKHTIKLQGLAIDQPAIFYHDRYEHNDIPNELQARGLYLPKSFTRYDEILASGVYGGTYIANTYLRGEISDPDSLAQRIENIEINLDENSVQQDKEKEYTSIITLLVAKLAAAGVIDPVKYKKESLELTGKSFDYDLDEGDEKVRPLLRQTNRRIEIESKKIEKPIDIEDYQDLIHRANRIMIDMEIRQKEYKDKPNTKSAKND